VTTMPPLLVTRRPRGRAPLLALLVACLMGVVRPGAAQERAVGLITHQMDRSSTRLLSGALVKHAKTTLYWDKWEADDKYRRSFADGMQRLAESAPEITVVVHAAPRGSSYATRAAVYRDFAVFVKARAAQFPVVRNWQLWNEMDAPGWTDVFGSGAVPIYEQGKNYATMLRSAHDSIKKANPNARVVIGGLAGPDDQIDDFLRGVYDGGGKFDVVAVHAYGPPIFWAARDRGLVIRALMQEKGDVRPLWLTEFGISMARMRDLWQITTVSGREQKQRDEWADLANWNDASRTYDRLIGYVLIDASDDGYGIVRANGATRPAYDWLRARNQ
jgi:hypothetical protein